MTSDRSKRQDPDLKSADNFAEKLSGFGPIGIIAIIIILLSGSVFVGNIILPIGALLVLIWVRLSKMSWSEIGYLQPKSWVTTIIIGIVFGITFKLIMKAIVMPLLGADPVNQAYHYLAGNSSMLPVAIWAMIIAGFAEETVFRGYLFERFGKLFGSSGFARASIILVTSILFGLSHYITQGWYGVAHAAIFGLVFGIIYSITRRIFMLMIAHTAFDLAALVIIYWDLETDVAHLFFK